MEKPKYPKLPFNMNRKRILTYEQIQLIPDLRRFLTKREVAILLGCCYSTVGYWQAALEQRQRWNKTARENYVRKGGETISNPNESHSYRLEVIAPKVRLWWKNYSRYVRSMEKKALTLKYQGDPSKI